MFSPDWPIENFTAAEDIRSNAAFQNAKCVNVKRVLPTVHGFRSPQKLVLGTL